MVDFDQIKIRGGGKSNDLPLSPLTIILKRSFEPKYTQLAKASKNYFPFHITKFKTVYQFLSEKIHFWIKSMKIG